MQFKYAFTTLALAAPAFAQALSQQQIKDAQTSLTIPPQSICTGCAFNGQEIPVAGQVASLTSTNNYANFCLQFNTPNQNGEQLFNGSCSQTPLGQIMAKNKMVSQRVVNPPNNAKIVEGTDIDFQVAVRNLITGHFTFAAATYYSAPAQIDPSTGFLIGHTHISVEAIASLNDATPTDPQTFAFFKGYDNPAVNGVVSVTAVGGLKAGFYRACTLGSSANHTPIISPVAQRGSQDDCTRFEVTAAAGGGAAASTTAAASSSAAASSASASSTAAAGGKNQNAGGKKGGNKGGKGGKRSNLPTRRTFSPSGRSRVARHE